MYFNGHPATIMDNGRNLIHAYYALDDAYVILCLDNCFYTSNRLWPRSFVYLRLVQIPLIINNVFDM